MKVALVIPSYNSSKFLSNCVQSAAAQSYDNLKIYIYDNNSTDGSYEMANNLASQSDIIDVVQVENIYKNSYREAFDHSFQNLDFDYITFLAADDYISKKYISSYMSIISKSSNKIKCIQSYAQGVLNNRVVEKLSNDYKSLNSFKQLCLSKSPVVTPTVMYHKSIYEFLTPKAHLDNSVEFAGAEDYDMYCNLADKKIFIYPVPKMLGYYYRWHDNQSTWQVSKNKKNLDYDKMIQEYWSKKWQV